MKVLTPAYGRDYKSAEAALKSYRDGFDFVLNTTSGRTYCSVRDFPYEMVEIRYNKLTQVTFGTIVAQKDDELRDNILTKGECSAIYESGCRTFVYNDYCFDIDLHGYVMPCGPAD